MPRLCAAFVFVLLLPMLARAGDAEKLERWYIVQMQGQRAGWMRETVTTDGDRITSDSEMKLKIKRDAINLSIGIKSNFVETIAGKPVSMQSTMQLGALPTTTSYVFMDDGVRVTKSMGKAPPGEPEKLPLPEGDWLTPRAAERLMTERIAAGDQSISMRSLEASQGLKPITTTNALLERTTLEVVGKTVPALKWTSSADIAPTLKSIAFTDEHGSALRTDTNMGGISLTMLLADKDLALAKLEPPELLVSTLIKPDHPIPNPRELRRAAYRVESTGDALPDLPTLAAQKFTRRDAKSGILTVDMDAVADAPAEDVADTQFSSCSTMITCDDADVKRLTSLALGAGADGKAGTDAHRAEKLRKFVYEYIDKKSLGVGFASAAEVADTRTGDCSEHGVLLAAMLRAAGMPSRVVSGIVYVDGFAGERTVFGYHMWAQALVKSDGHKRWIDVDAALSDTHAFDATHIALAPTSLSESDTTNALVKLAPLIGTLKISVEETK